MIQFFREHSFSITLGTLGVLCSIASKLVEHGGWMYDFWMMLAGVLLGCAITAVAGRFLWEKNCDPSRPPE